MEYNMECNINRDIIKSMKKLDKILKKIKIIKKCICLPSYYKNNFIIKANLELQHIESLINQHDNVQHNLDDYCDDVDSLHMLLCDGDMRSIVWDYRQKINKISNQYIESISGPIGSIENLSSFQTGGSFMHPDMTHCDEFL